MAVDHADRIIVVTRGDWPADGSVPREGRLRRTNSPTGIARERETRGYDAEPGQRQCHTTFFMRAG